MAGVEEGRGDRGGAEAVFGRVQEGGLLVFGRGEVVLTVVVYLLEVVVTEDLAVQFVGELGYFLAEVFIIPHEPSLLTLQLLSFRL